MRGVSVLPVVLLAAACTASPEPCIGPGSCAAGTECLANRCVPAGGEPVDATTERRVAEPLAMAVVSSAHHDATLPSAVTFGGVDGDVALYLRFAALWRGAHVDAAFLLLEPMPGALLGAADVPVDVWRVDSAWQPASLGWLAQPRLAQPASRGLARAAPPQTLRIDVTAQVRYLARHPASDHGLVVRGRTSMPPGASFATGVAGGRAPRLEVYVRP